MIFSVRLRSTLSDKPKSDSFGYSDRLPTGLLLLLSLCLLLLLCGDVFRAIRNISAEQYVGIKWIVRGEKDRFVLILYIWRNLFMYNYEYVVAITKEGTPHLEAEFIVRFNIISHEKAKVYAEKLFQQSIFSLGRCSSKGIKRQLGRWVGSRLWASTVDVTAMLSAKKSKKVYQEQRLPVSEEVLTMQGVAVLESWIQSNEPNLNIPRFRLQWAQLLWDNNITTVRRLLKYGEDLDLLRSVKITDMYARDIFKSILDTNEKAKRALWDPTTVKYQWTSNADQHNKDTVEYVRCWECCCSRVMTPCCLNSCMCCLPVCLKHIFDPDEKKSVKYQWTKDADEDNKDLIDSVSCCECCCSCITTPQSLVFCCFFLPAMDRICAPENMLCSFLDRIMFLFYPSCSKASVVVDSATIW